MFILQDFKTSSTLLLSLAKAMGCRVVSQRIGSAEVHEAELTVPLVFPEPNRKRAKKQY